MLSPDPSASSTGAEINALYWIGLAVAAVLIITVNAGLILTLVRARRTGDTSAKSRSRRNGTFAVGGVLGALAIALFVVAVVYTGRAGVDVEASASPGGEMAEDSAAAGERPLVVLASGQQWLWRYEYPDGTFSYYEMVLPVGQPVKVELESTDVLHRWWIPGLTKKADAVPGQTHVVTFIPDREGVFEGASYAFSGANFAEMRTQVRVVSTDEFDKWLTTQGAEIASAQDWVESEIAKGGPYGAIDRAGAE